MERVRDILFKRSLPSLVLASSRAKRKVSDKACRAALSRLLSYRRDHTRPALMSLACEAVGGDPVLTEGIGSSFILVGSGIDIHDDIIDQSPRKDFGQTVLGSSGPEITLILGDVLFVKGLTSLALHLIDLDIPPENMRSILTMVENLLLELSDAEAGELRFRGRMDITPRSYLYSTRKKAADVEAYMKIGAILGGGSEAEIEALARYGRALGMIVILRDDLADMLNFKEEFPHRVKYEHLPLPILYALDNPQNSKRIKSLLRGSSIGEEEAKELFKIAYERGGLASYEKVMKRLVRVCRKALSALPQSEARSTLETIADITAPPPLADLEL